MHIPDVGDLLVQQRPGASEFEIADAITRRVLSGPYATFADAAARAAAHAMKIGINLWRANVDAVEGVELLLELDPQRT